MGLIAAMLRVFTVIVLLLPLRSCSISRFLTLALLTLTVSELPRELGLVGPPLPCRSVVVPNVSPYIQGDGVAVGIPLRHAHAGGDVVIPQLTEVESGPPPVWVIESVANELLFTVAVRTAFTGDVNVSETAKLPLLSTIGSFRGESQVGPGRRDGDVLDGRRRGLALSGQGDEVEVGGAREIDIDRRDRAAGGERCAAPVDRATGHDPHTRRRRG